MKKYIIILLSFVISLNFAGCINTNTPNEAVTAEQLIGLTANEFHELFPEVNCFQYTYYTFFRNEQNDHCVVHFNESTFLIDEAKYYNAKTIDKSDRSFNQLTEGMTIYEVVERVGIPTKSRTSGLSTVMIEGENGWYEFVLNLFVTPATITDITLINNE